MAGRKPRTRGKRAAEAESASDDIATIDVPSSTGFRVFISWSGPQSKALAHALRAWLPLVLHYVEPWVSEADIEAGKRWSEVVAQELEASNFGIICVTRHSANAPWILFEAGALAKSLEGSVIPLLLDLDLREISGPLAQFQAKKTDQAGMLEVVRAINNSSHQSVPEARLESLFDALWPQLEKQLSEIPRKHTASPPARPQGEILEELVSAVRSLDIRLLEGQPVRGKTRSFERAQARDFAGLLTSTHEEPIGMLVLAATHRDTAPWLYDLALQFYLAVSEERWRIANRLLATFIKALKRSDSVGLLKEERRDAEYIAHLMQKTVRFRPGKLRPLAAPAVAGTSVPNDQQGPAAPEGENS